ncbi:hypothetical protein FHR71_003667 [Methylobacterium sp. RAS18]|nr:hypothetical protein [Methylobacterium sp. RAS18]
MTADPLATNEVAKVVGMDHPAAAHGAVAKREVRECAVFDVPAQSSLADAELGGSLAQSEQKRGGLGCAALTLCRHLPAARANLVCGVSGADSNTRISSS